MKSKLLLDANLSWRSIAILKKHFDDCFHVDSIGLTVPANDRKIWEYAKQHDIIIVTNDEDFLDLSMLNGFPPKIVLLKTGNQSRKITEHVLINAKPLILDFILSTEYGILELI
jgi:predicted nuclease of predicted toxin-antitoxin system